MKCMKKCGIWLVLILIFLIFVFYGFVLEYKWWFFENKTDLGNYGDSWGVLTSLFSALAFWGVVFTILEQRKELKLTRDDIKNQQVENIIFKMIETHIHILDDIDLINQTAQHPTKGRDCFKVFLHRLSKKYKCIKDPKLHHNNEIEYINHSYECFWKENGNNLGHYFRYLYNIIKYIDNSHLENKKTYTNIVRAQLSDNEIILLFYNCLSTYGKDKFLPLAIKYDLFNNLSSDLLIDRVHSDLLQNQEKGESV